MAIPALILSACNSKSSNTSTDTTKRTVFFDKSGMDTTVNPADNLFLYANGTWLKKTKIPPSETGAGGMYQMAVDNRNELHGILEEVSKQDNAKDSKEQKVGDLYLSGLDTTTMDKLGYEPVKPLLAKINAVTDYKQLVDVVAASFNDGDGFLFGFYVAPDDKNSKKNVAQFGRTGIGLPDRDYYFNNDSATVKIRAEYVKYIAKIFTLTGVDAATANKKAAGILKLETAIAQSHSTPVDLRDPIKNYNKLTVAQFQQTMPDIDLKSVFKLMNINTDTVLVGQPKYYTALDNLLKTEPIQTWKDELDFTALDNAASSLSKDFRDANFEFRDKILSGQQQQKERWKNMVDVIDGGLGELLGQLYVAKYFPPDAKTRMLSLVNNLKSVYKERIERLDWMSTATKAKALEKLAKFTVKIGYPDKWKNYDDVTIDKGTYFANEVSIAKHEYNEMIKKEGKPVDKTEWGMTPPTVNAGYNPSANDITFPAGILQYPFFDKDADDAVNYGAIGMVIGHEMTHGFDDQGSQYDKNGNLNVWWKPEDAAKFKKKVQVVVDQFNKDTLLGMRVNGQLTTGENMADMGGITIAYQAFKNTPEGKSDTKIDGLTPDQRFFLGFAQIWRVKARDEYMRTRIATDPHSPEIFRVNGPLSNFEPFYKTFNVKPGDKLYRPENERVNVW